MEAGISGDGGATGDGTGTRSAGALSPGLAVGFYFGIDTQLSDLGLPFVPSAILGIAFGAVKVSAGVGILDSNDGAIGHAVWV